MADTHGVVIRNRAGVEYFNSSNTTWNFLSYRVVPAGQSLSWKVPEAVLVNEIEIQRSYMNNILGDQESIIAEVNYSGEDFVASGGTVDTAVYVVGR